MNISLIKYIEDNIFPQYQKNDSGHGISHIQYVIDRSMQFAKQADIQLAENNNRDAPIDYNMVYTIAAYHDIGHCIDPKNHEIISACIMLRDEKLKCWFDDTELLIMFNAIVDHRASSKNEPRSIYGKIVSSADRNTSIISILERSYSYRRKNSPEMNLRQILDESYKHICDKFGSRGYAVEKMYFDDPDYDNFIKQVSDLISNKKEFEKIFMCVNKLNKNVLREQIENYSPWNEQEITDKAAMLRFIDSFDDVVTRDNIFGHFTASAFVVNDYRTHALMLHHNIMGDYIYPGGHADGEYDLYSVALREVEEETGLKVEPMFEKEIYAIQAAPVKGHVKNGKYVPAHIHYDVLFMFKAKNEDMDKIRVLASENTSVEWWELCDTYENQNVVDWAKPVNRKIVQKMGY